MSVHVSSYRNEESTVRVLANVVAPLTIQVLLFRRAVQEEFGLLDPFIEDVSWGLCRDGRAEAFLLKTLPGQLKIVGPDA
jgi:hypothetical protein